MTRSSPNYQAITALARGVLLCLLAASSPVAAGRSQGPEFSAGLRAADESIRPGGQTELAIELKLEKGWHIYHPITLATGLPPTLDFELPADVSLGDLRFPIPALGTDQGREYLGLEGSIVILTTLRLADRAALEPLRIGVKVRALACQKLCVLVEAQASLILPVSREPPKAVNAKFFEEARESLPKPLTSADYLQDSRLVVSHTRVPIGGEATLGAVIKVKSGHHIQDRKPGVEGLVPARLFIETMDGVKFDPAAQVWPAPKVRQMEGFGKVRELSGEFVIQAPFAIIDEKFKPGRVRLRVLFQYQCCTEAGQCFAPSMAEGVAEFEVAAAGTPPIPNPDPIAARLGPSASAAASSTQAVQSQELAPAGEPPPSILAIFLGAFLGGAILNIMPCVLPVISLKIFGFVRQAREDRRRVFRMGLVYAAGILASFAVLAVLMVGARVAWGGLMQQPEFLIGLCAVVFAFALSLLGVYEIRLPGAATGAADAAASREGYAGAFLNGILATLLATPCVAPFLGSAIGLLVQMPPAIGAGGIMIAGLGLATPYVLLTAFPGWLRYLPKPGPWMVTFKQIVGFILVAVVLWLLSILVTMVEPGVMLGTLGLLLAIGGGCWVLGRSTLNDTSGRMIRLWLTALTVGIGGTWLSFWLFASRPSPIPWQSWSAGGAEQLAEEGYTVYLDYTATWCLTCQTNKKLVLETRSVVGELDRLGVYPIEADFTTRNKEMQRELERYGRAGVPLNVILPAGKPDHPIILPEVLTRRVVLAALAEAGPSAKRPDFWATAP